MGKYGYFINPSPTSLSDLTNDNNYMVIREYVLDRASLVGADSIAISDINAGSTIVKTSLNVISPFIIPKGEPLIELVTDSGTQLMNKYCNDLSTPNNYSTDSYYITNGNTNEIILKHTLSNMSSGTAILRLELYENLPNYEELLTSDNKLYTTKDNSVVNVNA